MLIIIDLIRDQKILRQDIILFTCSFLELPCLDKINFVKGNTNK